MAPNAERGRSSASLATCNLTGLSTCHDSTSSLDSNDRGRSIAKGGVTTPFPWKLHIMLDAMDKTGDKSIVCWQPHGRAFMVHKPKDFVQQVMSHFFNQTKYASFQRQLNLYGFSRLTHGPDKGAYYHNCFVRGKRHLCKGMIRQKIKGTKVRKSLSPEDEPNFYDIEAQTQIASQESTKNFNQSSSSVQSRVNKPQIAAKILSSEESLVSLVPSNTLDPFDASNNTSRDKPSTRMNTPANSNDPNIIEPMPNNSTSLSSSRIVSPQHYSEGWTMYDEVKAGDLLFFEGQPFRYLEHFEEVPANQQISLQLSKKARLQRPRATRDTPTNDVFQDRIAKIYFNCDSTRTFQNDMIQNTSCPA
mmetsp:Transcript_14055/g.35342  ORF Transcript_14055/g.35342 Transcript_14055/m.35342 type:complete len:361 (+) Transcript_14055:175-1257(+)|eukprot:CAMPEP_0116095772 /NCGR_PEP_ID=MMETSP0327-20121206/9840_1 /TAXON_ID=44447 /ORGANISM="Pseudo-nitzschia delicatissima, Strain B596" /LENGTH=360 /DNA_ID=CAMNT_0003587459 /DNA_START=168 /DNA_END=1250 /DNA_ORIENTATION=+